jgi:hypothetical protein
MTVPSVVGRVCHRDDGRGRPKSTRRLWVVFGAFETTQETYVSDTLAIDLYLDIKK